MRTAGDPTWSLGTLIWLPLCALIVLALIWAARWLYRYATRDTWDRGEAKWSARGCLGVAALVVIGTAIWMYPYKAEYHQWAEYRGTVESVESRLISGSNSTDEKFLVTLDNGAQFACDDTRCAGLDQGQVVTLSCKRTWQYTGTDGYDCRFVSAETGEGR